MTHSDLLGVAEQLVHALEKARDLAKRADALEEQLAGVNGADRGTVFDDVASECMWQIARLYEERGGLLLMMGAN